MTDEDYARIEKELEDKRKAIMGNSLDFIDNWPDHRNR
jgi:hypothetical protein